MMEQVQKKLVSRIRFPRMAWRAKFTLLLTLMLVFLLLVILLPLLRIQEKAVVRTSLERGLALTNSLAARNYFPVANNQRLQLGFWIPAPLFRLIQNAVGIVVGG